MAIKCITPHKRTYDVNPDTLLEQGYEPLLELPGEKISVLIYYREDGSEGKRYYSYVGIQWINDIGEVITFDNILALNDYLLGIVTINKALQPVEPITPTPAKQGLFDRLFRRAREC